MEAEYRYQLPTYNCWRKRSTSSLNFLCVEIVKQNSIFIVEWSSNFFLKKKIKLRKNIVITYVREFSIIVIKRNDCYTIIYRYNFHPTLLIYVANFFFFFSQKWWKN